MPTEQLPITPNPYTDERPLVVTDHPFRTNRAMLVTGAVVLALAVVYIVARAMRGSTPLFNGGTILIVCLALVIALALVWFARRLSTGIRVTVTGTELRRQVRRGPADASRVVPIDSIRLGLLASQVRYARKRVDTELVLFLDDGAVVWLADGLDPEGVQQIAAALSSRGIRQHATSISNEQLRVVVRKLRREGDREHRGER